MKRNFSNQKFNRNFYGLFRIDSFFQRLNLIKNILIIMQSYDKMIKVLLLGDSGVGKTCVINKFTTD